MFDIQRRSVSRSLPALPRWPADGLLRQIGRRLAMAELAWRISRERAALARLSPEQLADIGVNPSDAANEIARGYWDIPENRLRR